MAVRELREFGYVTTWFGRKLYMPGITGNMEQQRDAETKGANGKVQGTAADLMKIWLRRVWVALREQGLKAKLILTVHDEAVVECPEDEAEAVAEILVEGMAGLMPIELPVEVSTPSKYWS